MQSTYLILKLPRSGLCNKIIIWASAVVWCYNNNVDLNVRGWFHLPLGTFFRLERKHRYYRDFFISNPLPFYKSLQLLFQDVPTITSIDSPLIHGKKYYRYQSDAYILDLPKLAPYRSLILNSFFKIIHPEIKKKMTTYKAPLIGVHIRKGDFVRIGFDIDLSYYINVIQSLRAYLKELPHVVVFSDGFKSELKDVLNLQNVSLFTSENDLVDLLVLAKSQILVTSYESSYSYWAAFMSDGIVLHHPKAETVETRPQSINQKKYEGVFPTESNWPALLKSNLNTLQLV